jgi:hypothetical protein
MPAFRRFTFPEAWKALRGYASPPDQNHSCSEDEGVASGKEDFDAGASTLYFPGSMEITSR